MTIEEEVFATYQIDPQKLQAYGFVPQENGLTLTRSLPALGLQVIVTYNSSGTLTGKVMDTLANEEYVAFRMAETAGFRAEVRQQFIALLEDIRIHCCVDQHFHHEQTRRLNACIEAAFGTEPEFLWEKLPSYAVYRKTTNQKWFALIGRLPKKKLDDHASSDEEVDILNVKVSPAQREAALTHTGIYPAYHMNKKHWVSLVLDDTLPDDVILSMLTDSFRQV